ncbi:DUF1499 domain-containing protein [Shimia sp.]|uniref:DUF1499 domain-containing protein n=1 Tax=Shimia sp. TaxID=1954381 RepID=UPI003568835D
MAIVAVASSSKRLDAMRMMLFWSLVLLFLAAQAYVRLAPSDPALWHVAPRADSDKSFANGVVRRVPGVGQAGFQRLDALILATPRTVLLAGSPAEGMATYVSRTPIMGFPDYTTVITAGDDLLIYGRSRFGRRDLGVNAARVEGWIRALTAG